MLIFSSLFSSYSRRRLLLVFAVILLPVAYISLFNRLGSSPVLMWDESRLAINAAEMLDNGNWLVTHAFGKPDLWNTKPPLLIWIQAALFWAFGANEITLRLPSALAGLATTGLLAWFGTRILNAPLVGLLSALVLLTTNGYIDYHITRNGDYDSLLVFFTTWYVLSFYQYLEDGQRRYLWYTGIGITLAILTKSVAGALFLPVLLVYTILRRQLPVLLARREVYVMVAGVLGIVALYFVAREYASPGYWQAVYENDLGGRLLTDLSGSGQGGIWNWYLTKLYEDELLPWLYVIPFGFIALVHPSAPKSYRHLALLLLLSVVFFLTVISSAQTKFYWYEAPIYPLCAIVTGAGLALLIEGMLTFLQAKQRPWPLVSLFLLCIFTYPISVVWHESFKAVEETDLLFGQYIRRQVKEFGQIDKYTMLSGIGYNASMEFYRLAAVRNYGHEARAFYPYQLKEIQPNETVLICNPTMRARLDSIYASTPIFSDGPCVTLLITARK